MRGRGGGGDGLDPAARPLRRVLVSRESGLMTEKHSMSTPDTSQHVGVPGPPGDHHIEILTPEALDFVARLDAEFARRRREILTARGHRSDSLASGRQLDFPRATSAVRDDPHWRVAPLAQGLTGRQREFTGPPNAEAAAHALASGADVWIADFTEVPSPLRENILAGQRTLLDVCRRRTAPTRTSSGSTTRSASRCTPRPAPSTASTAKRSRTSGSPTPSTSSCSCSGSTANCR